MKKITINYPDADPDHIAFYEQHGFVSKPGGEFVKDLPSTLEGIPIEYEGPIESPSLGKAVVNNDVYQMISDRFLEAINKSERLPWHKPWNGMIRYGMTATNFKSKKAYRGINSFMLNFYPPSLTSF